MNEYDKTIEAKLKRYRPLGPPGGLKERIFEAQPDAGRPARFAVAASMVAALWGGLIWFTLTGPGHSEPADSMLVQVKREISRAGQAAQLLAVGDLLAQQPGGEEYAKSHYQEILQNFSDTGFSVQAKGQLKSLFERSVKQ
ncbi:MAG: hypothetical protein AMJ79_08780 [Phycisphaerae bacterium SM23_30]|nr:MAG: hypothetical protein AMJ79_08780 [Phycisphaerae bacterium SM23_30]